MSTLICGCSAARGCSLGALLFRFGRTGALERHLEDSFGKTERAERLYGTVEELRRQAREKAAFIRKCPPTKEGV
jgi:hypothetical protein